MTDMYQDLKPESQPQQKTQSELIDRIISGGLLTTLGGAVVWSINNAEKIQMSFENPFFIFIASLFLVILGGLVVYFLLARPTARREEGYKKSLRAAVLHANDCDLKLARLEAEFSTVARFVEGYNPSFMKTPGNKKE